MVLLFHAADFLLSFAIVILMCGALITLFSTLARRLNEQNRKRRPPSNRPPKRKSGR